MKRRKPSGWILYFKSIFLSCDVANNIDSYTTELFLDSDRSTITFVHNWPMQAGFHGRSAFLLQISLTRNSSWYPCQDCAVSFRLTAEPLYFSDSAFHLFLQSDLSIEIIEDYLVGNVSQAVVDRAIEEMMQKTAEMWAHILKIRRLNFHKWWFDMVQLTNSCMMQIESIWILQFI